MLFTRSIALLTLFVSSVFAGYSNGTTTDEKITTTLAPSAVVEPEVTTWTYTDEHFTSYVTFTFYKTQTISQSATISAANPSITSITNVMKDEIVTEDEKTTTITSTIGTTTHMYLNSTVSQKTAATSVINSTNAYQTVTETVYVTVPSATNIVIITADPVTQFVTVQSGAAPAPITSQGNWLNSTTPN